MGWKWVDLFGYLKSVSDTETYRQSQRDRERERERQKERGRQTVTSVVFYRNVSAVITNQIKFLIY
jgi:hypothetical protein